MLEKGTPTKQVCIGECFHVAAAPIIDGLVQLKEGCNQPGQAPANCILVYCIGRQAEVGLDL